MEKKVPFGDIPVGGGFADGGWTYVKTNENFAAKFDQIHGVGVGTHRFGALEMVWPLSPEEEAALRRKTGSGA